MTNKPLILFDLVSTLTQAGPRYVQAYIRMCQAWNIIPPAPEAIMAALGEKNLRQIIAEFTPDLPAAHIPKFMSDCNQACDALLADKSWEENLYPHARAALESLRAAGCTLGLYTGSRESALHAQIAYHDLGALFDPRFLRGKDNVRDSALSTPALKAAQIATLAAQHDGPVIVVGDSAADLQAAQAAGAIFIGFAPERARAQALSGAAVIFDDYARLPSLVTALTAQPVRRPPGMHR